MNTVKIISKLEKEADIIYKCYVSFKQESLKKELNAMLRIYFKKRLIEEGLLTEDNKLVFDFSFDIEMSDFELSYETLAIGGRKNNKGVKKR